MRKFYNELIKNAYKFDFPIHKPYYKLSEKDINTLWNGNSYFTGINKFFKKIEAKNYKIQNRVLLSRYRGKTVCQECNGSRLRKDTDNVKIDGATLSKLLQMPIDELVVFFDKIQLDAFDRSISDRILKEIKCRIEFVTEVG